MSIDAPEPPPSSPETPDALASAMTPLLDRIAQRVIGALEARFLELDAARARDARSIAEGFEALDKKNAARHKLVVNRLGKLEREMRTLDARVTALETTRIVLRGITSTVARKAAKQRKRRRRAAKRR